MLCGVGHYPEMSCLPKRNFKRLWKHSAVAFVRPRKVVVAVAACGLSVFPEVVQVRLRFMMEIEIYALILAWKRGDIIMRSGRSGSK